MDRKAVILALFVLSLVSSLLVSNWFKPSIVPNTASEALSATGNICGEFWWDENVRTYVKEESTGKYYLINKDIIDLSRNNSCGTHGTFIFKGAETRSVSPVQLSFYFGTVTVTEKIVSYSEMVCVGRNARCPAGQASQPSSSRGAIALPTFKLPYAKSEKVYWTGGPHAYLLGGKFGALYPSGQGSGLDFSNGKSFEVLAMADGKVLDASCSNPDLGCKVAIKHDVGGSVLIYAHLKPDTFQVREGDRVKQGNILGLAGNSGSGGGPSIHLHVELRDGSGSCQYQCMSNKSFGNPVGWDDLVQLVDGWYIGGYINDSEGKYSRNYDGSAIKGPVKVADNFYYIDNGSLQHVEFVRVSSDFKCTKGRADCELPSNHSNPSGKTQFARDDGKGAAFPSKQTGSPANKAGFLISTNTAIRTHTYEPITGGPVVVISNTLCPVFSGGKLYTPFLSAFNLSFNICEAGVSFLRFGFTPFEVK